MNSKRLVAMEPLERLEPEAAEEIRSLAGPAAVLVGRQPTRTLEKPVLTAASQAALAQVEAVQMVVPVGQAYQADKSVERAGPVATVKMVDWVASAEAAVLARAVLVEQSSYLVAV